MNKIKVVLEDQRSRMNYNEEQAFKVIKVFNSLNYIVGDYLPYDQVEVMLKNKVAVEIVAPKKGGKR